VLSSNATTHKAQLFALTQCVEVLSKNGADPSFASGGGGGAGGSSASGGAASLGPSSAWDLCPYLVEMAEWLYCTAGEAGTGVADVNDARGELLAAIDTLIDKQEAVSLAAEKAALAGTGTGDTSRLGSSVNNTLRSALGSGARSGTTRRSAAGASTTGRSSNRSVATTSGGDGGGGGGPAACLSIAHYESLARVQTMLAMLTGNSLEQVCTTDCPVVSTTVCLSQLSLFACLNYCLL
jgi:hypothetical protein